MWEGYTRHTGPELDTGGMRARRLETKPAGFTFQQASVGENPTGREIYQYHGAPVVNAGSLAHFFRYCWYDP